MTVDQLEQTVSVIEMLVAEELRLKLGEAASLCDVCRSHGTIAGNQLLHCDGKICYG